MDVAGDARALGELIRAARRVLLVTGAGISTGSGIPDFRGPQGVWKRRQPVYFDEYLASEDKRVEYWDYKVEGWEAFAAARPNAAHAACAQLDRAGRVVAVVTQNIDGLHQAAGSTADRVIEVHGTNRAIECLQCHQRSDPEPSVAEFRRERRAPRCSCGGLLKFATISFGQALDPDVLAAASGAAREADLVIAIGSTLSVQPAASIPLLALQRGAPYAIVNQGATDHDDLATLRIDGDACAVLPAAVEASGVAAPP